MRQVFKKVPKTPLHVVPKDYICSMATALTRRVKRWRDDPLRQVHKSGGRRTGIWVLREIDDDVRECLTEGEVMDAVLRAARLNNWLKP